MVECSCLGKETLFNKFEWISQIDEVNEKLVFGKCYCFTRFFDSFPYDRTKYKEKWKTNPQRTN